MIKKIFISILILSPALGFALIDVPLLYSQEEFTLEEITVTAQKREENQQKVPIAMEVISGESVKEIGRNELDEILGNISSVLIQSSTDGYRVSIRGVSNDNAPFMGLSAYSPSVAVNQDGVYTNRNQSNQNMYDIERVEVLFGPQATMYATASPGGIVNVISSDPKLDIFEGSGTLEYGNYNQLHTEGTMNAPLGDKIALRAAFSTSVHDGYLSNGSMDEDIKSGRLKALFQPIDEFSLLVSGELIKTGGQGIANAIAFDTQDGHWYTSPTAGIPGAPPQPLNKDGKVSDPWTSLSGSAGTGQDLITRKTTGRVNWDIGDVGTLSILGSYLRSDSSTESTTVRGSAQYSSTSILYEYEKDLEVRMTSPEDFPFDWIIGGNIYKSLQTRTGDSVNIALSSDWQHEYMYSIDEMKAMYGNITYPVTIRFRATAGARITSHESGVWIDITSPSMVQKLGDLLTYDKPNYKLGIEYDLAESSMLFADWSNSYRMNSAIPTAGGAPPMEEMTAYTAGTKNRFFGNRLQANFSAYYYDWKNYYANMPPLFTPYDSNGDGILDAQQMHFNMDFGDARVYGADIQTSTIITSRDKLDLSVSYVKKYFTRLFFDFEDVINDYGIADLDYSGKDMPQAPNWNLSANYSHNFSLGNGGFIKASLDLQYVSETCLNWQAEVLNINYDRNPDGTYTGGFNSSVVDTGPVRYQEAYRMVNINIVYSDPSDKWTLSGYVNNLENYAVKRFLNQDHNLTLGNPRTYGGVLSVKF